MFGLCPVAEEYALAKNPDLIRRYNEALTTGAEIFQNKSWKDKRKELKEEEYTCQIHDLYRSKALELELEITDIVIVYIGEILIKSDGCTSINVDMLLNYVPEEKIESYIDYMTSRNLALGKLKAIREYREHKKQEKEELFPFFICLLVAIALTATCIGISICCYTNIYVDQTTGVNYINIKGSWVPRYDSNGELIISEINNKEDN